MDDRPLCHLHLDPLGGIAGDMFAAALLDAFPDAAEAVTGAIAAVGLPPGLTPTFTPGKSSSLGVLRFALEGAADGAPPSGAYPEIVKRLRGAGLDPETLGHALGIFRRLAEAEASVHGVAIGDVHFHEVADWDSIADVVAAASLLTRVGRAAWSCGPLPKGGGSVATRHGRIPLPAPATVAMLKGFKWHDDGIAGERVTPTGAAILRHLLDDNHAPCPPGTLIAQGSGAGTRDIEGMPNILRVLVLDRGDVGEETIARLSFEIDDMTPEELAVALDHLRTEEGVLDAGHGIGFGKKGRVRFDVRLLARIDALERLINRCFEETSTLGLRYRLERRRVLARAEKGIEVADGTIGVKRASRPGGRKTVKAESDDLAPSRGLTRRRKLKTSAESAATDGHDP
ncbi:MAG: LarC family nickel insertion protein [Rhodospirillales bacterium]|jgi:hypothetical protein|nr:LarC family nickel insertion protein [Rhodospirillales bacterium]